MKQIIIHLLFLGFILADFQSKYNEKKKELDPSDVDFAKR
jgi:hypothetical protein